jgi:predicted extracellular nuclease
MKRLPFGIFLFALLLLAACTQQAATPTISGQAAPGDIVINEIMQNPSAVFDSAGEWFELYNPTSTAVDIEGWTVADNDFDSFVIVNGAPLLVPAGGYLVLGNNADAGTNGGVAVDYQYASMFLSNSGDELVLLDGSLTEIDRVEWDNGATFPDPSGASMSLRDATSDNNVGGNWCTAVTPFGAGDLGTPGAANDCPTISAPSAVLIHEVQGSGSSSPLLGQAVIIEGVIVGDFQDDLGASGDLNGFFVQEEDAQVDGDATTSEGIFVFEGSDPTVDLEVGDLVEVTGTVEEFFGHTQLGNVTVVVKSKGNALPTTATVTLPVADINDLEAFEGMRVLFPQSLSIVEYFNFDRFGEVVLATDRLFQPTALFAPGSADAAALADLNARSRITLDDGLTSSNPDVTRHPNGDPFGLANRFRGGDLVTDAAGVLNYSFGLYRIQPTEPADFSAVNARPAAPEPVGGSLSVASFNVLNFFLTLDDGSSICGGGANLGCRGADNAGEFDRQRAKILNALIGLDADIVGLIEMENTPGVSPLADIVAGLNAELGAGTYDYVDTGVIGTDAIKVGFIYKPAAALPVGDFAILDSSVDPTFIDTRNRPALAQSFVDRSTGGLVTVVNNHLKSKGSSCSDIGDPDDAEQGNCNGVRTDATNALATWLATDPTGSGDADVLIVGDLNAYDKEDPITALTDAGYTDLIALYQGEYAYSFVFSGAFGYLDHALANGALLGQVTGTTEWGINADEPDLLDYDTSFKSDAQDAIFDPTTPFRASDHDPVLVGLDLDADVAGLFGALRSEVAALRADGSLNRGQANALTRKLTSAERQLDRGKVASATDILQGFIDQVNEFVADGILSADQGASLTAKANVLLATF